MESLLAINVWAIGKDDQHAVFLFPNFPYVDNECEYAVAGILEVQINMITKRMVSAKLDQGSIYI